MAQWTFAVPDLPRMQAAESARGLWHKITNDQAFQLEWWVERALGVPMTLIDSDDPAEWDAVSRIIVALDRAVDLLGRLFPRVTPHEDVWTAIAGLETVPRTPESYVLIELLQSLADPLAKERPKWLDHFVRVTERPEEEAKFSREEYDVFISYRHQSYASMARALREALVARGLVSWLDEEELAIARGQVVEDVELRRRLREALAISRHTVFFETVAQMTVDADFRGSHTAWSWQAFEQRYSRGLMIIRPGNNTLSDKSDTRVIARWQDIDDLADTIAEECRSASPPDQARTAGPEPGSEPDLGAAVDALHDSAGEYLGRPVRFSPMASLTLLSPWDQLNPNTQLLSDDVLINLLRYDPVAAGLVADAGLELVKLFGVGAKLNGSRWEMPGNSPLELVFGSTPPADLEGRDALGTADVLVGLIRAAQEGYAARELLRKTLRWMRNSRPDDDVEDDVDAVLRRLLDGTQAARDVLGRHGWLLLVDADAWRAVPVMLAGTTGPVGGEGPPAAILQAQSSRLFPADLVRGLSAAIAAGTADADFIAQHPEIRHTCGATTFASVTVNLEPLGGRGPTFLFASAGADVIEGEGQWPAPDRVAELARRQAVPPALGFAGRTSSWQPALLRMDTIPAVAGDESTVMDLMLGPLRRLSEHALVRELEFDDF